MIADDQALVRHGFRLILRDEAGIEVVGEAANGREAVEGAARLRPDVILMDVRMPVLDGIAATREIVASGAPSRVLILTTFDLDEHVYDALEAGASGFLLKDLEPARLAEAVRVVAQGEALLAPTVTRRLIADFARRRPAPEPSFKLRDLTEREAEVLRLLARGHSNQEIAADLGVSDTTIKTHVAHVLGKLDLRDRIQAVILAYETGLVRPASS
ncbi:MAG: response regulator transcription factor [Candidatus Dormibacteraeota bacterium]|nr:response regulator transcription factor [Candidatus Dormibacteraeota bacterium]MDQ6920454.1 response regulator transcription factor [Candidatus Dormibacteraeota bacterium]